MHRAAGPVRDRLHRRLHRIAEASLEQPLGSLSYLGDADVGPGTNIGAANVTANYDGVNKHHTTIGDYCRTGSDTMFVAPVNIGDGAYTGAGTVVTEDVPAGALAIKEGRQRNIEGWVEDRRPGTDAAEAAKNAKREC